MRICLVCHEASLTGAPRLGFDLALFLSDRHEVHLVVKAGGPLLEQPRYAKLQAACRNVETYQFARVPPYTDRVEGATRVLREIRPDLLYVNSVAAGDWCEAGARAGVVVALHTHEMRSVLPILLSRTATPRLLEWTDLLVGDCREALDDLQDTVGVRFENVLDFGIHIDTEAVLAQGELGVPPPVNARGASPGRDRRRVAMCGHAQPRKGADIFFDLACRLPQYDFLWIGAWGPPDTEDNDPVFERFRARSIDNLYVTGLTANPYAYLREIDTFLLTSREDPNPVVVAEALLFGKKVVAFSETGGSKTLLSRFGYVLHGAPDSGRAAALLPEIVEAEGGLWLSRLTDDVRPEVDGAKKLAGLQERLEDLVERTSPRERQIRILAAEENVSPSIHPEDHIFRFLVEDTNMKEPVRYYFSDGRKSATRFASLLKEFLPDSGSAEVLEFASGYGCVGRHWKNVIPDVKVTCCDIHDEAVEFLRGRLDLPAVLSDHEPEGLDLPGEYDVVFALSFFSHMPRGTWGRWLEALFKHVRKAGCLMFTTHGPDSVSKLELTAEMPDDGFWFRPVSEQRDLDTAEYGTTAVTPEFVFGEIGERLETRDVVRRPAYWWGHQDLYVVGK